MKKSILPIIAIAVLVFAAIAPVLADGEGTIRISPSLPVMVESPATFQVWVQPSGEPTNDPHILLVMTKASYDGLTGDVTVSWTGGSTSFAKADFTGVDSGYVPPSGTTEGVRYQVASLKDHLGTTEPIYWAFEPFLSGGPITTTPVSFTVTLPSTSPRMLVYVLGKTGTVLFNNRVPPTIPGFVVPEPATIVATVASLVALIGYTAARRRKLT